MENTDNEKDFTHKYKGSHPWSLEIHWQRRPSQTWLGDNHTGVRK